MVNWGTGRGFHILPFLSPPPKWCGFLGIIEFLERQVGGGVIPFLSPALEQGKPESGMGEVAEKR